MSTKIKPLQSTDIPAWDAYVHAHPQATLYHLSGWKNIIEKTYGHKTYYLMAIKNTPQPPTNSSNSSNPMNSNNSMNPSNSVIGLLPLVHLKHFLFGNSLISIPFFDLGGILADNEEIEKILISEAINIAQKLRVNTIELRHTQPLSCLGQNDISQSYLNNEQKVQTKSDNALNTREPIELGCSFRQRRIEFSQFSSLQSVSPMGRRRETEKAKKSSKSSRSCLITTRSQKVRMLLHLPQSSEILMKSFKSKLRSQIKKPIKEGLYSKISGLESLEDFYNVFLINMRDLGSPVHSKKLIRNVFKEFPERAKIVIVYKDHQPVACSLIVGFADILENPWASALRKYSDLSPNMLLYWAMLKYACDKQFKYFDFGRSSPEEGTYKFKEQWGARRTPLYWHYISLDGQPLDEDASEKSRFEKAIHLWQKLPVPVTKILGPMIRKHIGL
jgi:FemAB-related protein (PEP-CTERM system-associated)